MSRQIFSTFLIIISVTAFLMYVNPNYEEVRILKAESKEFDEALVKSRELHRVRDGLLSKYNTFSSTDLKKLEKLLPDNVDNVRLILDLDGIASRHGLQVSNLSIATEEKDVSKVVTDSSSQVGKIGLSLKVNASYNDFKNFVRDLEQSLRIVDVKSLNFAPKTGVDEKIDFNLTINTYWLK